MKHPVDHALKSICDQIVAMNLSSEQWLQRDREPICQGPYECLFLSAGSGRGAFHLSVKGIRDFTYDADPMAIDDIRKISGGQVQEIEIQPRGGSHPEDYGLRRVVVDPEILFSAINDAINIFVQEVLIPRGLVDKAAYFNDPNLVKLQHEVARHWAQHWKISCWNDAVAERALDGNEGG